MIINDPATLAEMTAIFEHYEDLLRRNDVAALDRLFGPSDLAVRYGGGAEDLYGLRRHLRRARRRRAGTLPDAHREHHLRHGVRHRQHRVRADRQRQARRQMQGWARPNGAWRIAAAPLSMTS